MIAKSDLENMMKALEVKPEEFGLIKNLKPEIPGEIKEEGSRDSILEVGSFKIPIHVDSAMPEGTILMAPTRLWDAIKRRCVKDALDELSRR